jgi:hypothetical protein
MKKNNSLFMGLKAFGVVLILLSTACNEKGGSPVDDTPDFACDGESVYGPLGGTIAVTDTTSVFYGLRIVVPPGALADCRSLYVDDGYVFILPRGCIGFPNSHAQFDLSTGGDKPYDLQLEYYFPVKGMTLGSTETPCAFGYDERTSTWNVIVPDSYDSTTMVVKTTYRDKWMWGKINLDMISSDHLIGAMKEKYGEDEWNTAIGGITKAIDILKTLYADRNCQTWIRMRDVDLPNLIEAQKNVLVAYQSQLGSCGTCDLLSGQFGLELSKYIIAKVTILTTDLWNATAGIWAGYLPFLSDVDLLVNVERYIAISFIESQACNYSCVSKKLGLGVYEAYAMHHVYMVTHLMVTLAINGDFWVSCP